MFGSRVVHFLVAGTGAVLLLGACSPAVAINPQPEPPGRWTIEGFVDLSVLTMEPTGADAPFGLDPDIVGDAQVDFSAAIIATFTGADRDGDGRPDNGVYAADLRYFRAEIGDTNWDETMPNTGILLEVTDGLVSGMSGNITCTVPAHPDLELWLPSSPGAWEARDVRGDTDKGLIAGTYALRDGTVPEPGMVSLLTAVVLILTCRRRRC